MFPLQDVDVITLCLDFFAWSNNHAPHSGKEQSVVSAAVIARP
ncbi:hypothetical protein IQ26_07712 [Mesorhizobium tianshanense]|uniref:Uncharacterized protein n=1 Tax=Mesorhizobium tianshanense TaxID=39844 RepID=A0A562M8V1_9HYPH|nr:hypothetical protein IQ26_07712 [Mesorhizobium tianshanense]